MNGVSFPCGAAWGIYFGPVARMNKPVDTVQSSIVVFRSIVQTL